MDFFGEDDFYLCLFGSGIMVNLLMVKMFLGNVVLVAGIWLIDVNCWFLLIVT